MRERAVHFEIDSSDSQSDSNSEGAVFDFKDISEEIKSYKNKEMSSFQRINLFLSDLGNVQLQKYLQGEQAVQITKEDDA